MSTVAAVCRSATHQLSKPPVAAIWLLAGRGVEGDCHAGERVQHRSRNPELPNLRQVHLVHVELLERLALTPGQIGENITTRGLDLLGLPRGARLRLGEALVEVTGLRNPCTQLDGLRPGLMAALLGRDPEGRLLRLAGVMAVVLEGGAVRPGDPIEVELPEVREGLEPV